MEFDRWCPNETQVPENITLHFHRAGDHCRKSFFLGLAWVRAAGAGVVREVVLSSISTMARMPCNTEINKREPDKKNQPPVLWHGCDRVIR